MTAPLKNFTASLIPVLSRIACLTRSLANPFHSSTPCLIQSFPYIFHVPTALNHILSQVFILKYSRFRFRRSALHIMRSQSITLIAALFGAVTAVPCYELGWQSPEDPGRFHQGLEPFGPQSADRRWDIVDARDCWVRWQPIQPGQSRNDARVTKTVFEATESQVRSTMNNFFNNGGTNIQLWLPMVTRSLQYVRTDSMIVF